MADRKEYMKKYNKEYYIKNEEKLKIHQRQWRKDNPEKAKEVDRRYRENHPEKIRQSNSKRKEEIRNWAKNHPEKIKEYMNKYVTKNCEKILERSRQWGRDNREKIRLYQINKRKTDLKFNLNCKMGTGIRKSLSRGKNGYHWEDLVDYTLKDLIKHLKKTMPEGYNWNDCLSGKLHIDHIIPISIWDFDNPNQIDFRRCWALSNLQLLPAQENLSKGAKLSRPFQPVLQIRGKAKVT